MHLQPHLGQVAAAIEVCNVEGQKIETVERLYRCETKESGPDSQSDRPEILDAKTGLFGWGEHLYIPLSAIEDATTRSLFLSRRKRDLDHSWRKKLGDLVPIR